MTPDPQIQDDQPPRFFHRTLANGRVEISVRLGDFSSLEEAEKAANETMHDLAYLWSMKQVEAEMTTSTTLDSETVDQMTEEVLREFCGWIALRVGMTDLWETSQKWPGFQRAWNTWRAAFGRWQCGNRRFPALRGPALTRYLWEQKQFIAHLKLGSGSCPDFYKDHAFLLFTAAKRGDAEFFQQFAETQRRKTDDPRLVQFHVMTQWMPMALWSCKQEAVAKIIQQKFKAWGNYQPANPAATLSSLGESVRKTWEDLGLMHDRNYRIADWTEAGQPEFVS